MRVAPFVILLIPELLWARPAAGTRGMAATAHPLATNAAVEMLRAGGNAADAAVAAAFALGVVEQYSSGLGGGGFALVRIGKTTQFLDFREVAPRAASAGMFMRDGQPDTSLSQDGKLAAGVPGAVAGYLELHARHGKLRRDQVLAPAIRLAENGFALSEADREELVWRADVLRQDTEAKRVLLFDGDVPPIGHILKQPDLAATLRAIARDGADTFYRGAIAKLLIADIEARGGIITADDLASYRVRERTPLVGSFRGHAIISSPPPSSGGTILLTLLNVLETLPSDLPWRDPTALHVYLEGSKRAFADRALLGDPDFVTYVPKLVPQLIAKDRAALLRLLMEGAAPASEVPPGQGAQLPLEARQADAGARDVPHTTHLSVVDADGNAVALTSTVNYGFGAAIMAKGTGVIWNDQMDDFAVAVGVPNAYGIVGSQANAVAPGKVPLSSMAPTFVLSGPMADSPIWLVLGSPGGSRIPTTVAQAIWHLVDHKADVEQAITLGRVHHQHLPDVVRVEPFALDAATADALRALGYELTTQERWSNATIVAVDPTTSLRSGAADPRGIGTAAAE